MIATLLFYLGVAAVAQNGVFVCNLNAIATAQRPHTELVQKIRAAARERQEVAHGYAYRLDGQRVTLPEVAEWIAMERLCCPFLTLQTSVSGKDADWWMTLSGPDGVKALLNEEFPAAAVNPSAV